ncbi:MAG: hypothetical protein MMC33_009014 [Icmadophila ericetorum]|nr:hypothetical protein [Icmadophila ericetorum]
MSVNYTNDERPSLREEDLRLLSPQQLYETAAAEVRALQTRLVDPRTEDDLETHIGPILLNLEQIDAATAQNEAFDIPFFWLLDPNGTRNAMGTFRQVINGTNGFHLRGVHSQVQARQGESTRDERTPEDKERRRTQFSENMKRRARESAARTPPSAQEVRDEILSDMLAFLLPRIQVTRQQQREVASLMARQRLQRRFANGEFTGPRSNENYVDRARAVLVTMTRPPEAYITMDGSDNDTVDDSNENHFDSNAFSDEEDEGEGGEPEVDENEYLVIEDLPEWVENRNRNDNPQNRPRHEYYAADSSDEE